MQIVQGAVNGQLRQRCNASAHYAGIEVYVPHLEAIGITIERARRAETLSFSQFREAILVAETRKYIPQKNTPAKLWAANHRAEWEVVGTAEGVDAHWTKETTLKPEHNFIALGKMQGHSLTIDGGWL